MGYDLIRAKLARGETIILDGGTGTDIQRRGAAMSGDTWCADANLTHPDAVRAVHAAFNLATERIDVLLLDKGAVGGQLLALVAEARAADADVDPETELRAAAARLKDRAQVVEAAPPAGG